MNAVGFEIPPSPVKVRQISSAVKLNTGAMSLVRATAISKSTVCEPRRNGGIRAERVETILKNIEIDGAQVHRAEIVQRVKDRMKLKILIALLDTLNQIAEHDQCPAIQFGQLLIRDTILSRIEIVEITQRNRQVFRIFR